MKKLEKLIKKKGGDISKSVTSNTFRVLVKDINAQPQQVRIKQEN